MKKLSPSLPLTKALSWKEYDNMLTLAGYVFFLAAFTCFKMPSLLALMGLLSTPYIAEGLHDKRSPKQINHFRQFFRLASKKRKDLPLSIYEETQYERFERQGYLISPPLKERKSLVFIIGYSFWGAIFIYKLIEFWFVDYLQFLNKLHGG
jgi:hypothetical protein